MRRCKVYFFTAPKRIIWIILIGIQAKTKGIYSRLFELRALIMMFICRSATCYVFFWRVVPRLLDRESFDTDSAVAGLHRRASHPLETDLPRRSNIILSAPLRVWIRTLRGLRYPGIGIFSEYEPILKIFAIYVKFSAV